MSLQRAFEGFETRRINTGAVTINARIGGSGPPLLLLHGYPQTHVMWNALARPLADVFTVVCADLRGYGDSDKPAGAPPHTEYAKRTMAADQVNLMRALGFETFRAAGHDRGGRVLHRMALDYPDCVERAAVLDIVPTHTIFMRTNRSIAWKYYHWYFLSQPAPFPETMIGRDPIWFLEQQLSNLSPNKGFFDPEAYDEYRRCFSAPACVHATCEDYRAAAAIDLEHDEASLGRKIACPLLAMWGGEGVMAQEYDVETCWRAFAADVTARPIEGAGHYLAEERPEPCLEALLDFFFFTPGAVL